VLVARGSRLRDAPEVWDVAEFFVLRRHRTRGVGRAAAEAVWRRFPGEWEVRVMEGNEPALAFWTATIAGFTGEPAMPTGTEAGGNRWRVFRFRSPGDADRRGAPDGEG
jgi:GNAT superfamily N-acetyltransferase